MQRWEYLELHFGGVWDDDPMIRDDDLWADSLNRGGQVPSSREVRFTSTKSTGTFRRSEKDVDATGRISGFCELLNRLGEEGWELVFKDSSNTYLFKRPKE